MMRRFALLAVGAAAGALAAGSVAQFGGAEATAAAPDTYRQLNLFGEVFERIRADYVEEPDDAKLIESAVNGMLSSLDPHSSYLNAKDYQDMQVQTRGEFFGLGIEVTMENELIKVISPIDDTRQRKRCSAGDVITHSTATGPGRSAGEAVEMRGPRTRRSSSPSCGRHDEPLKVPSRDVTGPSRCDTGSRRRGYIRVASSANRPWKGLEKASTHRGRAAT